MSLLSVKNITMAFGSVTAVDDVSFELHAGQLLALLGPNGAGKSTCFNVINGQLRPARGSVRFDGHEIAGIRPRDIWRLGVGRTFQVSATFGSMTVLENVQMALLSFGKRLFRFWAPAAGFYRREALALLERVGMAGEAGRLCGTLSYGDVKRVELAMALANRPKLLLMDEPTAGMAPAERHAMMAMTKRLVREDGLAVLFTEHSMDIVFEFADRMIVLARGKLIAEGDSATIRNDEAVRAAYFGRLAQPCMSAGTGTPSNVPLESL
ncbi:ABC transporter ATP-binding protein [Trinickia fusca]|uniref:ABC transporter ATP-binding protein n=1 Tax=Trinickia fusca TaxID=2419777 RepID=A0A494X048_9BURK|nr:ABC transporter ATP-binding protein [Trinickia fusca]RKP44148.1 ABC transporter ATP-binding protein [Trinickia fusca]